MVEIQELPTDIGPIFLLKIGGENVRLYLSRDEADIVKEYMTKVILVTIIEFLLGSNINIGAALRPVIARAMIRKNNEYR